MGCWRPRPSNEDCWTRCGLDGCILPAGQLQQGRQSEWRSDVATRHPQAAVTECAWWVLHYCQAYIALDNLHASYAHVTSYSLCSLLCSSERDDGHGMENGSDTKGNITKCLMLRVEVIQKRCWTLWSCSLLYKRREGGEVLVVVL